MHLDITAKIEPKIKEENSVEAIIDRSPSKILTSIVLLLKPGIILSVTFTGFAGMVLANRGIPSFDKVLLGILSLFLSASGSAILNNIFDRQIDVMMKRLKRRVEALRVVGERAAIFISIFFIAVSLSISFLFLNYVNGILIIAAILSYNFLYTLYLKRLSPYGTIPGGIPGALPVLIGYSVVNPRIGMDGIILFLIMLLWQPPHFWALAQKYKEDYRRAGIPVMPVIMGTNYTNIFMLLRRAGIPVMPVIMGTNYTNIFMLLYSISLLPLSLSLWLLGYCSVYYALVAIILGFYFEYVVFRSVLRSANYGMAFGASIIYILILMASLIIDVCLSQSEMILLTTK